MVLPLTALKVIGQGGFGVVQHVVDSAGKNYALKTFQVNQISAFPVEMIENVKKRFIREARTQGAIQHVNVMPVVADFLENDPPAYLMPLASSTLSSDIPQLGAASLTAVMDILAGLGMMHSMGITHRDLKPANVLRISDHQGERYVISDFGLMSLKDTQLSVLTQTGMVKGSDYYTAPEIVADLRLGDARTDIYSVGCILHDIFGLTQRIPCSEINDNCYLGEIISYCTKRNPELRFDSVESLREAILAETQKGMAPAAKDTAGMIGLLTSNQPLNSAEWDSIIRYIDQIDKTPDIQTLLLSLSLQRIQEVLVAFPQQAKQLGIRYAAWVRAAVLNFETCDGVASRLEQFLNVPDISLRCDILMAFLQMGTSHNRWFVEGKFTTHCTPALDPAVAKRMAVEIRVLRKDACRMISHLERSITYSRQNLHPYVIEALADVCT